MPLLTLFVTSLREFILYFTIVSMNWIQRGIITLKGASHPFLFLSLTMASPKYKWYRFVLRITTRILWKISSPHNRNRLMSPKPTGTTNNHELNPYFLRPFYGRLGGTILVYQWEIREIRDYGIQDITNYFSAEI